jgi:hypothetical protein
VALVAALAAAPSANAETPISAGTGRGSYSAATAVTAELGLSTGVADVKTALAVDAPTWSAVKDAYYSKVKTVADEDRTGDPVFDVFKAEYGSATFITDYFDKVVVSCLRAVPLKTKIDTASRESFFSNHRLIQKTSILLKTKTIVTICVIIQSAGFFQVPVHTFDRQFSPTIRSANSQSKA